MRLPLAAVTAMLLAVPPVAAQSDGTLTLAQVERKYRSMSPVHIEKCDYDHNELFTRTEMLCVSGIYQQMYVDRN